MAGIGDRLLVGDAGGTKTLLAVHERRADGWHEIAGETLRSAEHAGLEIPSLAFLAREGLTISAAAYGVAGPVEDGVCRATNLPWIVDQRSLAGSLGVPVTLVNDFEAVAWSLPELRDSQLFLLQPGLVDPGGPMAVLGAGTGLGEALLVPGAGGARVVPTEGGHTDFAPRDELEDDLLRFLRARHHGRVSFERILSGRGLGSLHAFFVETGRAETRPTTLDRLRTEDPGAVVGELAAAGTDEACVAAVDRFVSIYGSEAGNLALKSLPSGGLFVAGGIAPRMLEKMASGEFVAAFLAKGRMRAVLERIRVQIVVDSRAPLVGARVLGERL